MSRLISFAWAYSGCKERKPMILKWKILTHTGTRNHDPWFSSLMPYLLGRPVWYTNDNLNLSSRIQVCTVLFIATSYHARKCFFCYRLFVIDWDVFLVHLSWSYCNHALSVTRPSVVGNFSTAERIQRHLTGSKVSTSSTTFVFFGPIGKTKKVALASDCLRHFRLLLGNRWM